MVSTTVSHAKPKPRQRIHAGLRRREGSNSPDAKVELNCGLGTRCCAERGFHASLRIGTVRRRWSRVTCANFKFVRPIVTPAIFLA